MIEIFVLGIIVGILLTLFAQLLWLIGRDSLKSWVVTIIKENKNEPEKKI